MNKIVKNKKKDRILNLNQFVDWKIMQTKPITDQHTFLHVKQRLDYYRLPSSFPIEATSLLSKILNLLDGHNDEKIYQKENLRYQQLKESNQLCCSSKQTTSFSTLVDEAVRLELGKYVKENNQLHMQIMTLKQQLSALNHVLSKSTMEKVIIKSTLETENKLVGKSKQNRQKELFDELEEVKYNFNQLIDFVHSQSNNKKQYIKKLLKHKRYSLKQQGNEESQHQQKQLQSGQQLKKTNLVSRFSSSQIQMLKQKVKNRQEEIRRLQNKLQFDGINMNRILKDFTQNKQKQQMQKIKERIQFLQQQNKKIKDENQNMKTLGGGKQALREHIYKLKAENLSLKQKLQQNKNKTKELEYGQKKEKTQHCRKLNQTTDKLNSLIKQKAKDDSKGEELQKKQKILENQLKEIQTQLSQTVKERDDLLSQNQDLRKQLDNQKLMKEYERQKFARKQMELTEKLISNQQKQQMANVTLLRQNQILKQTVSNLEKVQDELMKRNSLTNANDFVNAERNFINNQSNNQVAEYYKQELNELRNKLYAREGELMRVQNQVINLNLINDKCKKEIQFLKNQNITIQTQLITKTELENSLNEMSLQLHQQKELLEIEKTKNIKYQVQVSEYEKITKDFSLLKQQYFFLQKAEKERIRSMQVRMAELEEIINLKTLKNEEKQSRIATLEAELLDSNERLRQTNKELASLDEELHKLRMDKNRLQRKHAELFAEFSTKQQKEKNTSLIKESQLLSQIQKLTREMHKNKILVENQQVELDELTLQKTRAQRQINELSKTVESQKQQIQNHKQRQQLDQIQIRQLRSLNEAK